ncbi:MAG: hypothetical protein CVU51_05120 [Deltaproteobacteria bacterium HGW-Deltaproteobacteria-1]|nr:MAG: hypothetical protein CVU51_05120 [Deltaproteobacteria bacterium HGW-Deltaproteobacteria-1]
MEDSFKGSSKYALTAKFTKTAINRLAGEWSTEVRIGENARILTEYYQPIDESLSYFVAVNAGYRIRDFNDYNEDGDVTTQYRSHSVHAGLDVGRQFGNWGELRLGINREYGSVRVLVGDYTGTAEYYNREMNFMAVIPVWPVLWFTGKSALPDLVRSPCRCI